MLRGAFFLARCDAAGGLVEKLGVNVERARAHLFVGEMLHNVIDLARRQLRALFRVERQSALQRLRPVAQGHPVWQGNLGAL